MGVPGLRSVSALSSALVLLVVLTGCSVGGDGEDGQARGRKALGAPAAVLAPPGPKQCLPPGKHLYFQLVRVRASARVTYVQSGLPQTDLARPRGVEVLRAWVHQKPRRFKATGGTRPWPYGMGRVVSMMTGWHDSWDPLQLPDERPRYLERGWNYVFVLLEGRHAHRADIRIGWESRSGHDGELRVGRKVWFNKRCR